MLAKLLYGQYDAPIPVYGYKIKEYHYNSGFAGERPIESINREYMSILDQLDKVCMLASNGRDNRIWSMMICNDKIVIYADFKDRNLPDTVYTFQRNNGVLIEYSYRNVKVKIVYTDTIAFRIVIKKSTILIYYVSKDNNVSMGLAAYYHRKRPEIDYITLSVYRNLSNYINMEIARKKIYKYLSALYQKTMAHRASLYDRNVNMLILSYV